MYSDELVAQVTVTGMTELAGTPADDDMAMVVDVSDLTMAPAGTNKKIRISNLLSGNMSGNAATSTTAISLAVNPADCAANEFAQSIVSNGDLTCAAIADANVPNTITVNLAAAATALAANAANCIAGQFALGVDASGASECAVDDDVPEAADFAALTAGSGLVWTIPGTMDTDLLTPGADADSAETDTPSGLEFVNGQLTLIRGCANNEILKWDETADDWNCSADTTGAGGTPNILDLTDDGVNESTDLIEIATVNTGLSASIFSEPAPDKLLIDTGKDWPNAATATALANNPSDCGANQFAQSIIANGNLTCASLADADVPNSITVTAQAGSTWNVADSVTALSVHTGGTSLDTATSAAVSGAAIIGIFDEFDNANGATIQAVINDLDSKVQPLEATLTDIADGTIAENLVNTANPWAVNEGGTGLGSGTEGGLPWFTTTTALATSALLAQYGVMIGGGVDAAPSTIPVSSTTTQALFATATAPAFRGIVDSDIPDTITASGYQLLNANITYLAGVALSSDVQDVLEAANAAAIKAILGYMTDLVDETAPVAGGDLNMSTFGIYGAFTNLTAASATPSVAVGMNFLTANATADVNITDFTGTTVGMPFRVVIADDYTDIDFSGAALRGHGEAKLDDPAIGTVLTCIDSGSFIDCDVSQWTSLSVSTFISPQGTTPAQTANGSRYWDNDTFEDTVGNGTTREVFVPTGTKTDEMACSYEATGNNIDCDGSVGALTSTGTITSSGTFDATGAVGMTFGSADITSMTFTTDGTGNAEFTFPADVIGEADIDWGAGAGQVSCADIGTTDCGAITSSGNIQGLITPVEDADGIAALGAADMAGQAYYNTTKANDYVLPAAAPGLNACFYATSAHAVTIRPLAAGNDHIWYGASDCGEDDDLVGPATVGSFVCLHARDAVNWMTWGSANTWACE